MTRRSTAPALKRKPLRVPPDPGVDTWNFNHVLLGGPRGYCADFDWKEWRSLVRNLTKVVKQRDFTGRIPKCRGADHVETWLEELNFLIGRRENFADRKNYELFDLEQGSDIYRILFCPKGYKFPKSAMWTEEKLAAVDASGVD
jgi:hypothetical protein